MTRAMFVNVAVSRAESGSRYPAGDPVDLLTVCKSAAK